MERPVTWVEERNGGLYVKGSRVSLDSVVYAYREGAPPSQIVESFPSLSLDQIDGAIAYYVAHRDAVDEYLKQGEAWFEKMRQEQRAKNPEFYARLEAARNAMFPVKTE